MLGLLLVLISSVFYTTYSPITGEAFSIQTDQLLFDDFDGLYFGTAYERNNRRFMMIQSWSTNMFV